MSQIGKSSRIVAGADPHPRPLGMLKGAAAELEPALNVPADSWEANFAPPSWIISPLPGKLN